MLMELTQMPILSCEPDLYPDNLLSEELDISTDAKWWAIYTRSRQEKELMRRLRALEISCYCPLIPNRFRSAAGRTRTSYLPLFGNYVFVRCDSGQRYQVLQTNLVSQTLEVSDGIELARDLRQIRYLLHLGKPVQVVTRVPTGTQVRIKHGPFCGIVGTVLKQQGNSYLVVAVNFLQQGAAIKLHDGDVESLC